MFLDCCKGFEDYDKISSFQKFPEVWQYSEASIDEMIQTFQQTMKNKHKEKKKIIAFCLDKMQKAERTAETESIKKIEEYKKKEKHIFRKIKNQRDSDPDSLLNYDKFENELLDLIDTLKGDLMDIEMALQHSLEQARSSFTNEVS